MSELLQWRKKSAGYYSLDDLDQYDSEIARDLMFIHDRISLNPMRSGMTPSYQSDYESQKILDYTLQQISSTLLPAIQDGLKKVSPQLRKAVQPKIEKAVRHISFAQKFRRDRNTEAAGKDTEQAFMLLHDVIEMIATETRQVPKVKSVRPERLYI